ncbi:hypothetical protein [Asticcacaulis benevestitus]|uniref:hypothetical protein n=1 Tax=Asticcacaulis benevestitus TaxID=347481 RepID=UPI0009DA6E88|nr:hypothetical protein [Asticcacaulis benevestitus]
MSVTFFTSQPQALLNSFHRAIQQSESLGKITTWEISTDGQDYTHKAADWNRKAWFSAVVGSDRLTFNIVKPQNVNVTTPVYGYYHGHITETFLNHFDDKFSSASASARPTSGDKCA